MCPKTILNKPVAVKIAMFGWGGALILWIIHMVIEIIKAI